MQRKQRRIFASQPIEVEVLLVSALFLTPLASRAAPPIKTGGKTAKAPGAKPKTGPKTMTLEEQLQRAIWHPRGQNQAAIRLLDQGADPNARNGALFCAAVSYGDEAVVRAFLRHGAKVTPRALQSALGCEREVDEKTHVITEILLNHGADPNAAIPVEQRDDEGDSTAPPLLYTPLMVAAEANNLAAAKLLIERGAKINTRLDSRNPNGTLRSLTALGVAARSDASRGSKDFALCKLLLERGADFRGAQEPLLAWAINHDDLAFFDRLQRLGALPAPLGWPDGYYNLSLPMAKRMMAAGASPDLASRPYSYTPAPLEVATRDRNWPLTQFLIDQGARIEPSMVEDAIPDAFLSPARQKAQAEVEAAERKRYLATNPELFDDDFEDPEERDEAKERLRKQTAPEDLRWLDLFLTRGADPSGAAGQRQWENTLLHIAAARNRRGAIASLARAGARLEARDSYGRTALHTAIESLADEAVPALLDAGADLEARNDKGQTPLMIAANYGANVTVYAPIAVYAQTGDSSDLVRLLLARGADAKATDSRGGTALHYAAAQGNGAAVRALLERGALLEAVSKEGTTPLGSACLAGQLEMVRLLLARGASPDFAGAGGKTPRQLALEPFEMRMEVAGGGKLSARDEKESRAIAESYAAPIRAARKRIAALFRTIPVARPAAKFAPE